MKLYKGKNGELIEVLGPIDEDVEILVNGEPAKALKAGTSDGAKEKHVPALTKDNGKLNVVVGEVPHPMLDEHFITTVWAEYPDGTVVKKELKPNQAPEVVFDVEDVSGPVTVYEYCNLHGLWKNEIEI